MSIEETSNKRIALVDADSMVYKTAYTAEMLDGGYHVARNAMKGKIGDLVLTTDTNKCEFYIGTNTNYRKEIATIAPYKGNRDPKARPKYYPNMRKFLINNVDAQLCEGQEAEDVVGIRAYEFNNYDDYIVCNIDKDVDMISGHHCNYDKLENYFVGPEEAMRNFYVQVVAGDWSSDNIPGVYKILELEGRKEEAHKFKHSRYKSKLKKELSGITGELEMYEVVLDYYNRYAILHDKMVEVARLVWIRRYADELWVPPTERDFDYIQLDKERIKL